MSTNKKEDWMNRKWRPAMAWLYMVICAADFLIFPIAWAVFKSHNGQTIDPWDPITLKGAGLFHMAMGAVLGITAWTRGQEKLVTYSNPYLNNYSSSNRQSNIQQAKRVPIKSEDPLV
jgi:hypothetical protein